MNRYLTYTYRMPQKYCDALELLSTAYGVSPGVYTKTVMVAHIEQHMKAPDSTFKEIRERVEP